MDPKLDALAEEMAAAVRAFHTSADPVAAEAVLRAALADAFEAVGLLFPVNTTEAITGYLTKSEEWADQYRDWSTGTVTGGPTGDGLYPITDREGLVRWLASPAKVAAEVFDAVQANAAAIQALAESAVIQSSLSTVLAGYAPKSGAELTDATATAPQPGADGGEVATAGWVNLAIGEALAPFVAQMQNLTDALGGVASNVGNKAPAGSTAARLEALEAAVLALAPKADPILTGAARVSKPPSGANNTRIPTTAWVRELLASGGFGGGFSLPNAAVVTDAAYGARGDASTDDTNAFKAALASGKTVIIVPPGTYMISDTLQVPSNRTIVGYGVVSRLMLVPGVANNTNILAASGKQRINILDLVLDGNRLNQPSSNHTTCLQFSGVDDVTLNNVHGVGSLIDGLYLHNCKRLSVTDCRGYDNGYPGVDASGMNIDTCDGASINGFQGYNNGFHGLYVSAATNCSFANILVHDNSHDGVRAVWAAANCSFNNVQSYRNGWRGMMFSDGCYGISINNAQLTDNRRHGLGSSEIWSLQIANSFINGNDWSGIATSVAGDDISAVNVSLGGNGGGQIEQAPGSSIRIFNPA